MEEPKDGRNPSIGFLKLFILRAEYALVIGQYAYDGCEKQKHDAQTNAYRCSEVMPKTD
jgi:hypothetical protein